MSSISPEQKLPSPEIRLLLSCKENHSYLATELLRGDPNGRKYLSSLVQKGLFEILERSEYDYSGPTAYRSRIEKVTLSHMGRKLRNCLFEAGFDRSKSLASRGFTSNDIRTMVGLLGDKDRPESLQELSHWVCVPISSLYSVIARLSSMHLLAEVEGKHVLTTEGTVVARGLASWIEEPKAEESCGHESDSSTLYPDPERIDIDALIVKCRQVLQSLLGVGRGSQDDNLMILTDGKTHHIGVLFGIAADLLSVRHILVCMPIQEQHGELPAAVAESLKHISVLIAATTKSITYAQPIPELVDKSIGSFRIASIPSPTLGFIQDCILTDENKLGEVRMATRTVANKLLGSEQLHISSSVGTNLMIERSKKCTVQIELGCAYPKELQDEDAYPHRRSTNLMAGEVFVDYCSASGVIAIDHLLAGSQNVLAEPVHIEVRDNAVVRVRGNKQAAAAFEALMEQYDIREVTSLNIGCNRFLRLRGNSINDNKVAGNINFGFGTKSFIGGPDKHSVLLGAVLRGGIIRAGSVCLKLDAKSRQIKISRVE